MSNIDYNHACNMHVLGGPKNIFPLLQERYEFSSVLDVGCGTGTWLKVISDSDVQDFLGIDGIEVSDEDFLISKENFQLRDFTTDWKLNRKFDLAICFEVAEHLPEEFSHSFIRLLTEHSDLVIFSAACPHQGGQGHINCQWPAYWQEIFNEYGFACYDEIRMLLWERDFPEYWYKQNIFVARLDPTEAGKEDRILPIVHPALYEACVKALDNSRRINDLFLSGHVGLRIYSRATLRGLKLFISKKLSRFSKFIH